MLSHWLTRRVEFPIGGRTWRLVISYHVLLSCQELSGVDMLTTDLGQPSAVLLRALLYSALVAAGASCSIEEVGQAIARAPARARRAIAAAWAASMPDPDREKREGAGAEFTWLDVWGSARELHHLTEAEWLEMTPRMFHALQKLRLDVMRREEHLVGIVSAQIANFSMRAPDPPLTAEFFMLHKVPEPESGPLTGEQIMAQVAKLKPRKTRR